ncbi:hypothetical protein ACOSP7_013044 [Xanthoceras sorbifolium]
MEEIKEINNKNIRARRAKVSLHQPSLSFFFFFFFHLLKYPSLQSINPPVFPNKQFYKHLMNNKKDKQSLHTISTKPQNPKQISSTLRIVHLPNSHFIVFFIN